MPTSFNKRDELISNGTALLGKLFWEILEEHTNDGNYQASSQEKLICSIIPIKCNSRIMARLPHMQSSIDRTLGIAGHKQYVMSSFSPPGNIASSTAYNLSGATEVAG